MRKYLILCCIFSFSYSFAQEGKKNSVKFSASIGKSYVIHQALDGAADYDGQQLNVLSGTYARSVAKTIEIGLSAGYLRTQVKVTPSFYPGIDRNAASYNISLLTWQAFTKYKFLNYLYIDGRILADIETRNTGFATQAGFGLGAGLGAEYSFTSGIHLFLSPYVNQHALIPARREIPYRRLLETGLMFGAGYHF